MRLRTTARLACVVVFASLAITACDGSTYYPVKWPAGVVDIKYSPFGASCSTWKSLTSRASGTWSALGESLSFRNASNDCGGLMTTGCDDRIWVGRVDDRVGGTIATTSRCTSGGRIVSFKIVFDTNESWYTGSGTPSGSQHDAQSVMTHELGHVAGFRGHYSGSTDCPNNSARQTMCSTVSKGTTYWRTLGAHDKSTFEDAY
jgi:matrixin